MEKCKCKKPFKNNRVEFLLDSEYEYNVVPVTYWYPQLVRIYNDAFSFVNMTRNEFIEFFNPTA